MAPGPQHQQREPVLQVAGNILERLVYAQLTGDVRHRCAHLSRSQLEREAIAEPLSVEPERNSLARQRLRHAPALPELRQLTRPRQRVLYPGPAPVSQREKVFHLDTLARVLD